LLALKVACPTSLFISRGNHESEPINRVHGFYEECEKKYSHDFFTQCNKVMNYLPLGYLIKDKIFVVHGGLPNVDNFVLDDVKSINRFVIPQSGSLMSQILWSDPQDNDGISPSQRGEGILFGPDVTAKFLERNNLSFMIRSHVWQKEGYKVEHYGKCITIFSAPDYMYDKIFFIILILSLNFLFRRGVSSKAAFINFKSDLTFTFEQFESSQDPNNVKSKLPNSQSPIMGPWY
jgi:serine/threonine-protein phosphatase 5